MRRNTRGFIYLDIVIALFIFGLGFVVVVGIVNAAYLKNSHTTNYLKAINLASSAMDTTLSIIEEDASSVAVYLNGQVSNQAGSYDVNIRAEWENVDLGLINVTVAVDWMERGNSKKYLLYRLYHLSKL